MTARCLLRQSAAVSAATLAFKEQAILKIPIQKSGSFLLALFFALQAVQPAPVHAWTAPLQAQDGQTSLQTEARPDDASVQSIRARIVAVRERLAMLRTRYTDLYPDVIDAKEQLANLQRQLDRATSTSTHAVITPSIPKAEQAPGPAEMSAAPDVKPPAVAQELPRSARDKHSRKRFEPASTPPANHGSLLTLPAPIPAHASNEFGGKVANTAPAPTAPGLEPRRSFHHLALILFTGIGLSLSVFAFALYRRQTHKRQELYINDVASLRAMLTHEFDYIGSIPRMKNG